MSRIHDALRKAANEKRSELPATPPADSAPPSVSPAVEPPQISALHADEMHVPVSTEETELVDARPVEEAPAYLEYAQATAPAVTAEEQGDLPVEPAPSSNRLQSRYGKILQQTGGAPPSAYRDTVSELERLEHLIDHARSLPFDPAAESLLINPAKPKDAPSEEFRSLRTRLNHLQTSQPLHTLIISSASPNEGKSFTACNLAISQAQLTGRRILLADFDFRRPTIDKVFNIPSVPGITDYLLGRATLGEILIHIADSNLYVMPAGSPVQNPLELLNLNECAQLLENLRDHFDWVILDSPPLLFAADANLLATMADGTILVVRIGNTTFDSVTRAVQSLCENNVLGIVVNGADRGELYSKYSYYHNYYYSPNDKPAPEREKVVEPEAIEVGDRL